jgi:hypothetical protein
MREIKKSVFEENQRMEDEKNLEQFKALKDELNLTEKIFSLKTSNFNNSGCAHLKRIRHSSIDSYEESNWDKKEDWEAYSNNINKVNNQYQVLEQFSGKTGYYHLLVDVLEPKAKLYINREYYGMYIEYYHPEMDLNKIEKEKKIDNMTWLEKLLRGIK